MTEGNEQRQRHRDTERDRQRAREIERQGKTTKREGKQKESSREKPERRGAIKSLYSFFSSSEATILGKCKGSLQLCRSTDLLEET